MKLTFLAVFAYLAFAVLALVPQNDDNVLDTTLPDGAYWENEHTVVVRNDAPTVPDKDEDVKHEHDFPQLDLTQVNGESTAPENSVGNSNTTADYTNTTAGADDFPEMKGRYAIDVRVENVGYKRGLETPQHIGTIRGARLWRPIYDCLKILSWPQGRGSGEWPKDDTQPPSGHKMWCQYDNWYCEKECRIPNIVYDSGNNNYATNAHLTVRVRWAEIWESSHPGLRDVVINAAANAYMRMTDTEQNCRIINFKGSRATKVCNISPRVLVIFPRNGGNVKARLNVEIFFNGQTVGGNFDCDQSIHWIGQKVKDETRNQVAEVAGWPSDKLNYFAACQSYQCFDTLKYDFGKTWVEPNHCDSPTLTNEV